MSASSTVAVSQQRHQQRARSTWRPEPLRAPTAAHTTDSDDDTLCGEHLTLDIDNNVLMSSDYGLAPPPLLSGVFYAHDGGSMAMADGDAAAAGGGGDSVLAAAQTPMAPPPPPRRRVFY